MNNKVLLLLIGTFFLSLNINAQRGIRIGYIDMDYILENVPEYQEASQQLDDKVNRWKGEIETKLGEVSEMKKQLCLLYTSPSPRDLSTSRMPSSA